MAESAVSFLLDNFSTWLRNEVNLLGGLGPEVEYIMDELRHMRAFLRVADSREQDNPQLNEWTRQVREIAYDVEDVLDIYKLQFGNHDTNGFIARIKRLYGLLKGLRFRHQIASQIQTIKSRVENASQSYVRYKDMYPVKNEGETCYDGRGDALLLEDAEVVGIENPRRQLLQWLESTGGGQKVISVVGMPGMGKTTLVKKVYDDRSMKGNFDHHVWITVSESYKVEDLLARIIKLLVDEVKQPLPQQWESMNADEMREFIYRFLQYKSYVLVLDDVWRIDAWEAIKYAFPRSSTKSQCCIIITTRFNSIANAASFDTKNHVYTLAPLAPKDSKLLFYKKAFLRNSSPIHLKEISESILKRCEGLPLAIVVIGGLLATKNNNIQEWELFNRSIGDELEGDNLKRLNKLISLSFYDLPYYLKSCFMYLSIFPEDEELQRLLLVQLWVAEGFVQKKQGKTVEEVAEGYLNELVNRSLVQVVATDVDGTARSFRIHDLLREYIISKSRHENFIASAGGDARWADTIRRIALCGSSIVQESYNFDHLRSVFWFGFGDSSSVVILQKLLARRCRLLKVLSLRGLPLESIPDEVFKLYHLKFLVLSGTNIKLIPKSVKSLVNLETLDVFDTEVTQLPSEVLKLKKLRHLLGGRSIYDSGVFLVYATHGFQGPNNIGHMSSLHVLWLLDANAVDGVKIVKEIGKLTQLQRLGLTKLKREDGKDLCSSISKLNNLRVLSIRSIDGEVIDLEHPMMSTSCLQLLQTLTLYGGLDKIPHWISSLVGLTELNLRRSRLRMGGQDPLESIQGLPNLLSLEMDSAYEGEGLIFRAKGFQRLKLLSLMRLENLRWVKVEEGCMSHLEHLDMWGCRLLMEEPEGLQHLLHLQNVAYGDMSEEFLNKVVDQKQKNMERELDHVSKVEIYSIVGGDLIKG